ncbi:MAG: translation initiation factor IF-2 [Candidatus Vogelbacteria bacterium]|nr:translation initiation factor IF-2 [Candidatus Vogelbacteria bacterium]
MNEKITKLDARPPVIVIMGHIDHGKSALLDYIRKSNVVAGEAGGITQHLGAYEVVHKTSSGEIRKITFLDTPGHAAFSRMRSRGAMVADVAVLVVSAEEGVKPQTMEAYNAIIAAKLPFIIAASKIDKPNANLDRVKQDLATNGIYVEGYGGTVSLVSISSKTGEGISDLLDLMLLLADMREAKACHERNASGVVIESSMDKRRGPTATIIIQDGTIHRLDVLNIDGTLSPVRNMENFNCKSIEEATFTSPVRVVGLSKVPEVGSEVYAFSSKKEAERNMESCKLLASNSGDCSVFLQTEGKKAYVPLILKTDVQGSMEAILGEIKKIETETVGVTLIHAGVGPVGENDVKAALSSPHTLVIGFNVKIEKEASAYAEQHGVTMASFKIIYEIIDMLTNEFERRRPRVTTEMLSGKIKIIKVFNKDKDKQVVGGAITEGILNEGSQIKILRHDKEIGRGKIVGIEHHKIKVKLLEAGNQCGVLIDARNIIAASDVLEAFSLVTE